MARTFVAASSQYLKATVVPVSAVPLSLVAWIKPVSQADGAVQRSIAFISFAAASGDFFALCLGSNGSVDAEVYNGATVGKASTTTLVTAGAWQHVAAVFTSASSRAAYLAGGNKVTNATTSTPTNLNTTGIGVYVDSGNNNLINADIAEVAFYNVALTDADVLASSTGLSPLLIRPEALVAYWPLLGNTSPEIDLRGRFELTVTGATASAHPRIYMPTGRQHFTTKTPVAAGGQGQMFAVF
jgi:hypothetical protein